MSRRTARRERRQAAREAKKQTYTIEDIANNAALFKAYKRTCKGVMFKPSVQRYRLGVLFKNYEAKQRLLKGQDIRKGLISFWISERGKKRFIQSLHYSERLIQSAACTEILQPAFFKSLIKENSASQKGKGLKFANDLLVKHIQNALRTYNNPYILIIDFKKYFENINQDIVIDFYKKHIKEPRLLNFFINAVKSYDKGLGLGSEISQFNAISYINSIDYFIKSKFRLYGRYMDDSYIIGNKSKLKEFFEILKEKYRNYGIILSSSKTNITHIHTFGFLKTRYNIDNGRIIRKPSRDSITRERRRLNRQKKINISDRDIKQSFNSWAGSMKRRHARKSVYNLKMRIAA